MKFTLQGWVGRWVEYRASDPERFEGASLDEEIEARSVKSAVKQAKEIIKGFLKENKKYAPDPLLPEENVNAGEEKKYEFFLMQHVWESKFHPASDGKPGIPAVPAVPAQPPWAEEKLLA